jgi:membrane protein DedA with SNARE-associated domain
VPAGGGTNVTGISHHLSELVAQFGIPALFLSVALEALGAPLPGESAIIVAAGAASEGKLDIRMVVIAAFLAAIVGDNVGYFIGRRFGRGAIVRVGARFGVTDAAMTRAEAVVHRYGPLMVVVARFVVVLRQLNGLVAGTTGMPWPRFLLANVAGAALWVGLWATLAYRFGRSVDVVPWLWHHLNLVAMVAIPLLILAMLVLHFRNRPPPSPQKG